MAVRIEITTKVTDTRTSVRQKKLQSLITSRITDVSITDVYTIDKKVNQKQLETIASHLTNPVTQQYSYSLSKGDTQLRSSSPLAGQPIKQFSHAIEIGFLPGVTDNVSHTAKAIIEDMLDVKFSGKENVYTSQVTYLSGKLTKTEIEIVMLSMHNPLIQRAHIKSYAQYQKDGGMDIIVPQVKLRKEAKVSTVDLDVSDEELTKIGKSGIANPDGTRRGPLALDLTYMKTIQAYFKNLGRNPTDIELESLAQTWSEHCKHTIFADPIDEVKDGLFKTFIKRATEEIRKKKGKDDFCVSVFTDNSGAIAFDDDYLVTHKVETHNSPSALDPFGGAITGIVGVNRDTIGFGMGAKPVANFYGYCFADPRVDVPLYKDQKKKQKMLSSRRIMDGVIDGVNAGGNQSGIPTPQGFVYFDDRYRGKPLVFVGTIGLIPRKIKNKPSYEKKAQPGDYIVVVGGRVGKDGIHGATFSSEAMDSGSPATAVQIGDPITQKKVSDAIVKEARDQLLYNSITDNGAGGISCSIAEMGKESNGCLVDLEKVPLKYPGLDPWEIWISESQERMTLAVPPNKWEKFKTLMDRRGVEAAIVGEFTDSGKCIVNHHGKTIMDIDMHFLHDGLPERKLTTTYRKPLYEEPQIKIEKNLNQSLTEMLARLNITSYEFISQQYDHIVQGNAVLGPLQGRGRVNADTTVIRPLLSSQKGVIMSQALYPSYTEIDAYHMTASCIDTAVRNIITAGANPEAIALLDNYCWCSSTEQERLGQLKASAQAVYDYAVAYGTPYISGKDSMFNDFKGFDEKGNPIKISIPPTLLISSVGVIDDINKVVSLDAKYPGDLIYILGETHEEVGGSEYFRYHNEKQNVFKPGNIVPQVNAEKNKKLYAGYYKAIQKELIASGVSIGRGGLGVALAKKAISGMLGVEVSLKKLPGTITRDDYALYSESQGRMLVTIAKENKAAFEKCLQGTAYAQIGTVTKETKILVQGLEGKDVINIDLNKTTKAYRETFKDY